MYVHPKLHTYFYRSQIGQCSIYINNMHTLKGMHTHILYTACMSHTVQYVLILDICNLWWVFYFFPLFLFSLFYLFFFLLFSPFCFFPFSSPLKYGKLRRVYCINSFFNSYSSHAFSALAFISSS